ncbi:MAG: ParM/StbA family protein [Clostridiales bacterium]|nr:ParM/StbA family protein [Clostridiales bacterium]
MQKNNDAIIIGVDHGYGNIKTANHIFKAGIAAFDHEPLFTGDMLVHGGKYYVIGEGHKEFVPQKHGDEDYYLLTLAGIAMELKDESITEADVIIAAGLPLTWTTGQKAEFASYLTRNEEVSFIFRKVDYHIRILGARIYPQGYAAVAEFAPSMKGVNVIVDIGNGTMNTLFIIDGRPQIGRMFTEKFGTHQCTLAIREAYMREYGTELDEVTIEEFLVTGTASIPKDGLKLIRTVAEEYVGGIFRRLREHGYDESTMDLIVTGGGGCLVKNFYRTKPGRVRFIDDIRAAAKGYEYLAGLQLKAEHGV